MVDFIEKNRVGLSSLGLPIALALSGMQDVALAEMNVGGHVSVATDHVFRGVSQTMSRAAVEVEVDVESESGWYGYVWGSNVDFTDSLTPDDGVNYEIDFGVGYEFAVNKNVSLGFEAVTYTFPGAKAGYSYDYEEFLATISIFEQHRLTFGYTDDLFGNAADAMFYAVDSALELSTGMNLGLELGHYNINESLGSAYSYAALSVAGDFNSVGWQLAYITTNAEDEDLFYASTTADRVMLALSIPF